MTPADTDAARARTLWGELETVYDAIEAGLGAPDAAAIRALAGRLGNLEAELAPLAVRIAAARAVTPRPAPALAADWAAHDQAAARLRARRGGLEQAARTARTATGMELARTGRARAQVASYRGGATLPPPRFTSRRV